VFHHVLFDYHRAHGQTGAERRKLAIIRFLPPRGRGLLRAPLPRASLRSGEADGGEARSQADGGGSRDGVAVAAFALPAAVALPLLVVASVDESSSAVAEAATEAIASLRARDASAAAARCTAATSAAATLTATSAAATAACTTDGAADAVAVAGEAERERRGCPLLCDDPAVAEAVLRLALGDAARGIPRHASPAANPPQAELARCPLNWAARSALVQWALADCPGGVLALAHAAVRSSAAAAARAAVGEAPGASSSSSAAAAAASTAAAASGASGSNLVLRLLKELVWGDHGSLALKCDGAALAHFLAGRIGADVGADVGAGARGCGGSSNGHGDGGDNNGGAIPSGHESDGELSGDNLSGGGGGGGGGGDASDDLVLRAVAPELLAAATHVLSGAASYETSDGHVASATTGEQSSHTRAFSIDSPPLRSPDSHL